MLAAVRHLAFCTLILGRPAALMAQDIVPLPGLSISAKYIGDMMGVASGGVRAGADYLDDAEIVAEADLDRLIGWGGAHAQLHVLGNRGGNPNARSGSIQGIDGIEVAHHRAKLYEAWVEQSVLAAPSMCGSDCPI